MSTVQEKLVRAAMYLLGLAATVAFVITKSPDLLEKATSGAYKYGDLYRFCLVDEFKPSKTLPSGKLQGLDSLDLNASTSGRRVFVTGDSFSHVDWGEGPLWQQLGHKLGEPVFYIRNGHEAPSWTNAWQYLKPDSPADRQPKVLVYEVIERFIESQFSAPIQAGKPVAHSLFPHLKKIEDDLFANTEARSVLLLHHNFITEYLKSYLNTAKFQRLKKISPDTPVYSLHPPFLFYTGEVSCFRSTHDDELVNQIADNIASFGQMLSDQFDCTLVFVPVPNKITLYSKLALDEVYDDFLSRLCLALKERQVRTVDLLPEFKQQPQSQLLYWPTDTHWNNDGIKIAVREILQNWPEPLTSTNQPDGM